MNRVLILFYCIVMCKTRLCDASGSFGTWEDCELRRVHWDVKKLLTMSLLVQKITMPIILRPKNVLII